MTGQKTNKGKHAHKQHNAVYISIRPKLQVSPLTAPIIVPYSPHYIVLLKEFSSYVLPCLKFVKFVILHLPRGLGFRVEGLGFRVWYDVPMAAFCEAVVPSTGAKEV